MAKKKTAARATSARPDLRDKFVRLLWRVRNLASEYHRRFKQLSDEQQENPRDSRDTHAEDAPAGPAEPREYEPLMEEWESIKGELKGFGDRADTAIRKYDSLLSEIRASEDAELIADADFVDTTPFPRLLDEMNTSLADQYREACAPQSDQQKKDFWIRVRESVEKTKQTRDLADTLATELKSPTLVLTPPQATIVARIRDAVGKVVNTCVDVAKSTDRHKHGSDVERITAILGALDECESVLDASQAELLAEAKELEDLRLPNVAARVRAFAEKLHQEMVFDCRLLDITTEIMGAAIRLPKGADAAAHKIVNTVRQMQRRMVVLSAESSAVRGKKDRLGDLADPASIPEYSALQRNHVPIVDVLRCWLFEHGPNAMIESDDALPKFREAAIERGLAPGKTTIGNALRELVKLNVVIEGPGDRDAKGHGGSKRYRLSVPAALKFPPWQPPSQEPAESASRSAAPYDS